MAQLLLQGFEEPWPGRYGGLWGLKHQALFDVKGAKCSRIWDPLNAQFEPCVIRFIAVVPAVVAMLIAFGSLIRLVPGLLLRPWWLSTFVSEIWDEDDEPSPKRQRKFTVLSATLFLVSILGFLLQISTLFHQESYLEVIELATVWALCAILVAVQRPATTPKALLVLYNVIFVCQSIVQFNGATSFSYFYSPATGTLLLALGAIFIILQMPLRDPKLPRFQISPAFGLPTDQLRTPEDSLTLWQFMSVSWMAPLISLGNFRQLNDEDVWSLGYQFQHRTLHDRFRELRGSVFRRLIEANGLDLFIICLLGILELVANFSSPVLLQKILQSMEDHRAPKRAAFVYAIMSLLIRLIASQSGVFMLWYGRRVYERSRGELITMLYEKTLSRKMVSVSSKARSEGYSKTNGTGESNNTPRWRKVLGYFQKPFRSSKPAPESAEETPPQKSFEMASTGKIMNLMRFDAYEVAQRFWEFSSIVSQPLSLIFAVVLIWRLIGWPCLIGVVTLFVAQAVNGLIARTLLSWERRRRVATDIKLHKISQLVEAIRHLRYYGWEDVWLTRVMDSRESELGIRVITGLWNVLINFINNFASGMFPVVAFYSYTALAGKPLRVDIAFPALQLFSMLEASLRELPTLITVLLNARVSMGRIEEFMNEPDMAAAGTPLDSITKLEVRNATFAWPGATEAVLHNISLLFPVGLTVVYGEVGTGKTALLQALLGELDRLSGEDAGMNKMVGYCGQTPWLQSMSIRENILFSSPYDEARYRQVLEVCSLIPDMANFKHGDLSMVGENGVGLSGGQKARISLARAVYSRAEVLLLDDPLSALDHHTAELIVRKCISGPLLRERTTVLVTHRTELVMNIADQIIKIAGGRAEAIDREVGTSDALHKVQSHDSAPEESHSTEQLQSAAIPEKFMEDEYRAHGGVKASIYWEYIKAGKLKLWFILIVALGAYRLIDVGETWFLKAWGEAYEEKEESAHSGGPLGGLPSPETDIKPWLIGFLIIAVAQSIAFLISQSFMLVIIYQAGKNMFEQVMTRVSHATFRFYDITPVGRLMNRLTSDINTIDGNISNQFQQVALLVIAWISSVVVIGSVTPLFLVFATGLTVAFVVIFSRFLPTSQSLRRLEMVSLSPLISNFGELTTGLTSIRAFKVSHLFQQRVIMVTDNFQKMDHFYWSLQAWLMFRFDNLSALSTFLLTSLALFTGVSPGLTAFVLTAANKFVWSTHKLCKQYGQLQMDFVSVERVIELLHLDQEPPGEIQPPARWPSLDGDIVFENVTIQYAPHLDPALIDVSLRIKGGSTTALIGRTGSGKSTLALSLLATTLPTSGRILIDGIDISKVDTQALRKRITFLAQDPVLFPGTMRANLDPLDEYSDVECNSVLKKIAPRHQWSLDTHIDTGGRNLSQGQRQLVGLARALLRRSAIIIMDEATASIDMETAMRIQEILREEMKESTVITIAHRLEAVKGADNCVVLGKGRILERGGVGEVEELME